MRAGVRVVAVRRRRGRAHSRWLLIVALVVGVAASEAACGTDDCAADAEQESPHERDRTPREVSMASKDPTVEQWAATVLKRLRIRQTPGAVQALVGWARAEGGHWNNQARYNPLNTTQPEPGAGNTGSQGNIKVYRSWDQGIDATVKTLENGRYGGILQGLASGDPNRVANAIGQTPWGTSGDLVKRMIAGTKPPGSVQPYQGTAASSPGASPQNPAYSSVTTTTPGVDNSQQRKLAVLNFVQQGGIRNPQATSELAATYGQLADVPGTSSTTRVRAPASPSSPSSQGSGRGGSEVLELIYNDGGKGYGIKNGQTVNGSQVFSDVWAGHTNHVHIAAGPKTVVALGRLAESMGLHAGENPHFGGVTQGAHVADSYHYKGEAVDVSGDPKRMAAFARRVERYNRTRKLSQ